MIQVITSFIFTLLTISSLCTGNPLEQIFGPNTCWLYWFAIVFHNSNCITGSFGMAIFRLLCIKFQKYTFNPALAKQTVQNILIVEAVIDTFFIFVVFLGTQISGTNLSLEFCKGQTRLKSVILAGTEKNQNFGIAVHSVNIALGQFFLICEFVVYIWLFYLLYIKSKSNAALSKEMFQRSKKRNQITLIGQSLTFVVKMLLTTVIQFLFVFISGETTYFACIQIFTSAAMTVSYLVSSPEMRRKYHLTFLEYIFRPVKKIWKSLRCNKDAVQ